MGAAGLMLVAACVIVFYGFTLCFLMGRTCETRPGDPSNFVHMPCAPLAMFSRLFSPWTLARKLRNKLVHSLCGNGPPAAKGTKGSGKNKSKGEQYEDPEAEFSRLMRASIPEAARLRAQPALLQEEWGAQIHHRQRLTAAGGVAVCPKEALPGVLQAVGFTVAYSSFRILMICISRGTPGPKSGVLTVFVGKLCYVPLALMAFSQNCARPARRSP